MADKTQKSKINKYAPGSAEMEAFLMAGYPDMSKEKAEAIIAERKANPASYPYEMYERAQAFLQALNSAPIVVSDKPGWKREKR